MKLFPTNDDDIGFDIFYQIDFIDSEGFANYIDTGYDEEDMIKKVNYLNFANQAHSRDTKYVLDVYKVLDNEDDYEEPIKLNITNAETWDEYQERIRQREKEINGGTLCNYKN